MGAIADDKSVRLPRLIIIIPACVLLLMIIAVAVGPWSISFTNENHDLIDIRLGMDFSIATYGDCPKDVPFKCSRSLRFRRYGLTTVTASGKEWTGTVPVSSPDFQLSVPLAVIIPIGLLFAAFPFRNYLLAVRRHKEGLCVNCGYDLRESPERCPECGTLRVVPAAATGAAG